MKKIIPILLMCLMLVSCNDIEYTINRYEEIDGNTLTYKIESEVNITKNNYSTIKNKIISDNKEDIMNYKLVYIYYNNEIIGVIDVSKDI